LNLFDLTCQISTQICIHCIWQISLAVTVTRLQIWWCCYLFNLWIPWSFTFSIFFGHFCCARKTLAQWLDPRTLLKPPACPTHICTCDPCDPPAWTKLWSQSSFYYIALVTLVDKVGFVALTRPQDVVKATCLSDSQSSICTCDQGCGSRLTFSKPEADPRSCSQGAYVLICSTFLMPLAVCLTHRVPFAPEKSSFLGLSWLIIQEISTYHFVASMQWESLQKTGLEEVLYPPESSCTLFSISLQWVRISNSSILRGQTSFRVHLHMIVY